MKLRYLLLTIFYAIMLRISHAQVGMQQWRIHFATSSAVGIASDANSVYMAASNGIVQYHTDDNSIEMLTVANGLSDLGISTIGSNGTTVIVGYKNGNIDLINGNTITNIPWIKLADVSGNKSINNIYFDEGLVYLSTGVGLIIFDNNKNEIKDTYFPYVNPYINATTVFRDTVYAACKNGIYFAPKNKPFLNDFNNWTKKSDLPLTIIDSSFTEIGSIDDKLFFVYKSALFNYDTLFYVENNTLKRFGTGPITIGGVDSDDEKILVSAYGALQIVKSDFTLEEVIYQYDGQVPSPIAGIRKNDFYWIADRNFGLVKAVNTWSTDIVYNNAPHTDGCYRIDIQYGKVLVAGGGLSHNLLNNYFRNGVYLFEDETWVNFNYKTQTNIENDKDWDFVAVAVNPNNTNEFAFAGFAEGGIKIVKNGTTISEVYTTSNSTLEAQGGKMAIGDMKYDNDGNLWVICAGVEPLKVLTATGEWHSFTLGSAAKDKYPYRLTIDNEGNKWIGVTNAGMMAFNENGTFINHADDDLRIFSTSEGYGNLPSVFVKAIAEDLDGEIWVGTEEGLAILFSKNKLYDGEYGEYDLNSILIEVNGEVEALLGKTYITAIAVDGGNRKWIGTNSSGVFCLSPDGTKEVYRFTVENSPLVSNNVLDIKIDHFTGEVYFATDKGLVSFRSDASIFDEEFSDVKVFPNPVRPDFSGPITIQGLGYQSDVKVTDISGNVVLKTVSNGGTVIWDGKTLNGDRVQSGVYLVWTASVDGKGKNVAKILFIN